MLEKNSTTNELQDAARVRAALAPLGLHPSSKREVWEAWKQNPEGVERMAYECRSAVVPASAFLVRIRRGMHLIPPPERVHFTGWRWVRSSAGSGRYVRDPQGVDVLPKGFVENEHRFPTLHKELERLDPGIDAP